MRIARYALTGLIALALTVLTTAAWACPFCAAPSLTLSETVAQSDAVVLAQWAGGKKAEEDSPGSTTYEVVQVVKDGGEDLEAGSRVTLVRYRAGKKGDLFLLTGTKGGNGIEWGSPDEVTETSFNYVIQAPSPETPNRKRLEYFAKFLEFPDEMVAADAYGEFANSPYEDVAPVAKAISRERLRKWVTSPETPATRLGLYGMLLGLAGDEQDAKLMEKKITETTEDFRLGIDGVIGGYLLLTGERGLDLIDEVKLSKSADVPFSETYAAMQALRFMWTYGDGRIDKERLRQSMRQLLDRPELADLVIADLARWKDWSVQDRLMELYDAEDYKIPSIRRAVVRYLLVSTKDTGENGRADGAEQASTSSSEKPGPPAHVLKGRKHLETLREKDPKTVTEAERFFFVQ